MEKCPTGEESTAAIHFFVKSIKYMADELEEKMVRAFWCELIDAHEALAHLWRRSLPPR